MPSIVKRRLCGLRNQARADDGLTLVELILVVVVFGILSSMVLGFFVSANKSVATTSSTSQMTQAAANIMNELSRVIRSGTPNIVTGGSQDPVFLSASAQSLSMYSYVDANAVSTTPFLVQFTIDSTTGQVVEKRWPAIAGAAGLFTFNTANQPSLTRILPGRILSTSAIFTYLDANGAALTVGTNLAQRALVRSVTVNVTLQAASASAVTLQNTVGIPNASTGN
jgi:prepilin-type N-terminal cleavage/methylation domain-containing protein